MSTQVQDTFTRANQSGWGTPSGGGSWSVLAGSSTLSIVSNKGDLTGATATNLIVLIPTSSAQWYDQLVSARFSKTNNNDNVGVAARVQNSSNYYYASVNGGNLVLNKVVSGTVTQLGTTPFADGGALYWVKLSVQGFGLNGTANNIQAKAWLDGNAEPASYMLTASDSSLQVLGNAGVRVKANLAGNTQTVDSFISIDPPQYTPAPTDARLFDLPYGMTLYVAPGNPAILDQQTITDMQGISNSSWIRYQLQWGDIETTQGVYNWAVLDDFVYRCNQAGIRIWWCIEQWPNFRKTLDAYGNNTTLTASYTPGGGPYTSISVAALGAGVNIPNGSKLSINFGGGTAEVVTTTNSNTLVAGATSIPIASWTPANTHNSGETVYEQQGLQLVSASDMSTFASLAAARYNGTAGYGKIDVFQIGNEEYDAATRVPQQNASLGNGGAILAPVYKAAYTAIKSASPGAVVAACACRHTPNSTYTHLQLWFAGLFAGVSAIDAVDYHDYRDGTNDWDNTPVPDPTKSTYLDSGHTQINCPNTALAVFTILQQAAIYGFRPQVTIGEFGWLLYDDGTGFNVTTTASLTAGSAASSLAVNATAKTTSDATAIYIDTGGAHPEGPVYAWGQTNAGATSIPITTNPAGKGSTNNTQVAFTPVYNHNSPVTCYVATSGQPDTQTNDMLYSQSEYDLARSAGASHCFRFTIKDLSTVTASAVPQSSTNVRSWTQTISNVYTYMPGYYMTKLYANQASTRFWTSLPTDGKDLTMTGTNTALTMTGLGTALTMTGYNTALTMTESNP